MGLLDRLRSGTTAVKASPQPPQPEFAAEFLAAATACLMDGADRPGVTRGNGAGIAMTVAGQFYRQDALQQFAATHPAGPDGKVTATGVVQRDPTNEHDRNAVRVLVDGNVIGFLPADAAAMWQGLLTEYERQGVLLVGSVTLQGGKAGGELYARISLRPLVDGFDSGIMESRAKASDAARKKADAARAKKASADDARKLAARPMTRAEFEEAIDSLLRLAGWEATRTKQTAGLARKQFRELLPLLRGHADAGAANGGESASEFLDLIDDVDGRADDLLEAADADEREDLHDDFMDGCKDLAEALRAVRDPCTG